MAGLFNSLFSLSSSQIPERFGLLLCAPQTDDDIKVKLARANLRYLRFMTSCSWRRTIDTRPYSDRAFDICPGRLVTLVLSLSAKDLPDFRPELLDQI